MFALPKHLTLDKSLLRSHVPWLGAFLLLLQVFTFLPSLWTEAKVAKLRTEYREWWEITGKSWYAAQGQVPSEKLFQSTLNERLHQYTRYKITYWLNLVPDRFYPNNLLTAWWLHPGWISFFVFLWFYAYAGYWLEERWGMGRTLLWAQGAATLGAVLYWLVSLLSIRHNELPYTGTSSLMAATMGALLSLHKEDMLVRIRSKGQWLEVPQGMATMVAVWLVLDILINIFVNDNNYRRVAFLDIPMLVAGYFAAPKMPLRKKKNYELMRDRAAAAPVVDPAVALKQKMHSLIQEGWTLFNNNDMDAAQKRFSEGLELLLRNSQGEIELIKETFERILAERLQMRFPAQVWFGFGQQLFALGLVPHAINCSENALRNEPTPLVARSALVLAAEGRITTGQGLDRAAKYLQKVVQYKADDSLGRKASELLKKIPADASH